ncbi:hypothetical protein GDO86_017639 [Hymenochirus boettgeri]|uniref:Uncharacterized protein n=1 Tax=Hymenochirus boettgeri TaxID=247094 RepID=A0A8T2ITD8_9PIPI|nr:hypothetical protein GDO86_017639 [Hymenochirus boettgeri]
MFDDRGEPAPPPMTDPEQILRFAKEAEITGDFDLANTFYQSLAQLCSSLPVQRLARDRQNVNHWLDYGCFKLMIGDHISAQECFQEAVVLNREHVHSLLLCGIVALLLHRYKDAEVLLENATCKDPSSSLAWTLLGLFYEMQGDDIRMEMAFTEAGKVHKAEKDYGTSDTKTVIDGGTKSSLGPPSEKDTVSKGGTEIPNNAEFPSTQTEHLSENTLSIQQPERKASMISKRASVSSVRNKSPKNGTQKGSTASEGSECGCRTTSIYMEAAQFLVQVNALQFIERALAHELLSPDGGPSCRYHLICAQINLMRKEFERANQNLQEASQIEHQNPDVWALKGHLHFLSGQNSKARDCYEHTISLVADASDMHPVYLRLGSIYLDQDEYEKAKKTYLQACKQSPTCLTWLGVGIACYRLEELEDSEDALSEANATNNSNAEVWGYLTLLCLKTKRPFEAEQSYKYTMKLNLQNENLLAEIQTLQKEVGFGDPSF